MSVIVVTCGQPLQCAVSDIVACLADSVHPRSAGQWAEATGASSRHVTFSFSTSTSRPFSASITRLKIASNWRGCSSHDVRSRENYDWLSDYVSAPFVHCSGYNQTTTVVSRRFVSLQSITGMLFVIYERLNVDTFAIQLSPLCEWYNVNNN